MTDPTMTQSDHISLLEALSQDDDKQFRRILETEGLPRGTNWLDYDLLTKAVRQRSKRVVAYLLEKRRRALKNDDPKTLDRAMEKFGWGNIAERLLALNKTKSVEVSDKGDTALHLAFVNSLPEPIIDLLLRHYLHETTVNVKNREGLSFLHIACTRPNEYLAMEFLDAAESDVNCQVYLTCESIYSGYTPLHFAVEYSRLEVIKYLLQKGANIYAQDCHRSTPIHLALERGDKEIIDILLYNDNKNENYVNVFGLSHFMAACASSDPLVAEQYLYIAEQDPISSARILLDGRVKKVKDYTYACYTPLHFAAEYGRLETVQFLLAQGAHCCALTGKGLSPTDLACSKEYMDICTVLLQHSCDCKADAAKKSEAVDEVTPMLSDAGDRESAKLEDQVAKGDKTAKEDVDLSLAFSSLYLHVVLFVLILIISILMIQDWS